MTHVPNLPTRALRILPNFLFWSWNLLFVVFLTFGLVPAVLVHLVADSVRGNAPPDFAVFALVLALLPPVTMVVVARTSRSDPAWVLRVFYGVELPLMGLCFLRLFVFHELPPGVVYLGLLAILVTVGYGLSLWQRLPTSPTRFGSALAMALHATHALLGLYVGGLLVFFLPHVTLGVVETLRLLAELLIREGSLVLVFLLGIALPISLALLTLFGGLPIGFVVLGVQGWRYALRSAVTRHGRWLPLGVSAAVLGIHAAAFAWVNHQPHRDVFAVLEPLPSSAEDRARLLEHAPEIREGLVHAYLAPYRYLATRGETDGMRRAYERLGLDGATAELAFQAWAAPFLYDGEQTVVDVRKAERLYESFFDEPIQHAERAALREALTATWDRSEVAAGLVDRDAQTVLIERQVVTVTERGEVADVELHEVLQNQTQQPQEALYHFSLPESAVITGVWLGDTPERRLRFPFQVAPRGAAQRVYRAEVARKVDPALLEQVGPASYRLRVFPVPVQVVRLNGSAEARMHVWLTYRTFRDGKGAWPLPNLIERRNAFWDSRSELMVQGQARPRPTDRWWPTSVPAATPDPGPQEQVVNLGDAVVTARPLPAGQASLRGMRLGVLVDRSYSMGRHASAVDAALGDLVVRAHRDGAALVVQRPEGNQARFFGNDSPRRQLHAFLTAHAGQNLDAVVVLTDDQGFDRREEDLGETVLPAPLWLVHVGGVLPPAVDDRLLLPWLGSGGGSGTQVTDVLARIAMDRQLREAATATGEAFLHEDGRYAWTSRPAAVTEEVGEQGRALTPLAAARWIRSRLAARSVGDDRRRLDALAAAQGIVTPLSSMIVLVNDQQREVLRAEASRDDAFDTTADTGQERLATPFGTVSATPEPEEWLLLCVAVGVVVAWAGRRGWRLGLA